MKLPLWTRRTILANAVIPCDHVGLSQVSGTRAAQMIEFVRSHGLEGVVAKRADSSYQPGKRSECGRRPVSTWSSERGSLD
jgi:ATP-dependent DNA ligase